VQPEHGKRHREEAIVSTWLHGPLNGTLYLTSKCNFHCGHCRRESADPPPESPDMPLRIVGDFLRRFPTIRAMCLCGFGEPLMHDYLLPIFQYLQEENQTIGLITNGSLLADKFFGRRGLYRAGCRPHYISVSLNTHNPDEHRRISGTDLFDDVIDGIRAGAASPIPLYVSRVCTTKNLGDLPAFLEFVAGLGVQQVHLHNLLPYCTELDGVPFDDLVLQAGRDDAAIATLRSHPLASLVAVWPTLIDLRQKPQRCEHPYCFVGINGDGHMTLCNSVDYPDPSLDFTKNVWHSPQASAWRQRVRNCEGPCSRCFRNWMIP